MIPTTSQRARYVKRVCVIGAESTGKTTLARGLADRFDTLWVPEYGAVYHHIGRGDPLRPWTDAEFVHLARIRDWLEDFLAGYANRVLVCDTDTYVTAVFAREYLGHTVAAVEELGRARRYDLYVVCDPSTPFRDDELGLRREDARYRMHDAYVAHIRSTGTPYVDVSGDADERLETAAAAVGRLLS